MIQGQCITNLDDYDCSDTTLFVRIPKIGERVECKYKGNLTSLKVVQITHAIRGSKGYQFPFIFVELNK